MKREFDAQEDLLGEPKMCAICHVPLNPKVSPDGTITQLHGMWADHDPRPVTLVEDLTMLVCDFCLDSNPVWDMPARTTAPVEGANGTMLVSLGDWAACTTCKNLIVADRYRDVADRSMIGQLRRNPELAELVKKSPALATMTLMNIIENLETFREARTSDPIPVTPATWVAATLQRGVQDGRPSI